MLKTQNKNKQKLIITYKQLLSIKTMGLCISKRTIPHITDPKSVKSFIPPITQGRVIKCYDGDTITIASYLPYKDSELYKFSVRINGIDCPEIKSKCVTEKECAQIAKKCVEDRILHKMVRLENVSLEKYGRILADVCIDDISIGPWLTNQRLAVIYDGGTKKSPDNWMDYYKKEVVV